MIKVRQTMNRFLRRFHIRKKYKDALFRRCFDNKKDLLELYNALNHTTYDDTTELKITTLDDCIYLTYKNDLSFMISATLNLYEHQSTYNPNMPIRGLIYFTRIYEAYIKEHQLSIYGKTLIKLPEPRYIIFYNGKDDAPDVQELRLSDAFEKKEGTKEGTLEKTPTLECVAVMLNINYGHNMELMKNCKRLHDYAYFVNEVNQNLHKGYSYEQSVNLAMEHCEKSNILADIIGKQRSEVFNLLLNEFDKKAYERWIRKESKAEGKAEDIIELLEDIGEVSDFLRNQILTQTDLEILSRWLKLAARAQSIEDFENAIGLVNRM